MTEENEEIIQSKIDLIVIALHIAQNGSIIFSALSQLPNENLKEMIKMMEHILTEREKTNE